MANTFILTKSDGSVLTSINEGARDDQEATSLVLHGRGAAEYGLERDNNLVWLLENFADVTPPVNPIVGQIWYDAGSAEFFYCSFAGSPPTWESIINPAVVVPPTRAILAGAGLTGGGTLAADVTLNVGAGAHINVLADSIEVNVATIPHDSLASIDPNDHVDHTSVVLTAGTGLTGGGDITLSRTFNVGAGDGISVAADSVAVDGTVVRTSGAQTISGQKDFTSPVRTAGGSAAAPGFSFTAAASQNTGMYLIGTDGIGLSSNGTLRLEVEIDGTLNVAGTANYETLVTLDDDIPNKKYVDDAISAAPSGTTLYAGRVNADGTPNTLPVGWASVHMGAGVYRVTHNLGTTAYIPLTTPYFYSNRVTHAVIYSHTSNYFEWHCRSIHNTADGGHLNTVNFMVILL